jgi:hypothetical protein
MTTWDYIIAGLLAGSSAKMLVEQLSQLKADKARSVAKRTGMPIEQVTAIAEIDPTANGSYMEWLAKVVKNGGGNLPAEPEQIRTAITSFEGLKKIPSFKGNKNVFSYPTYDDFATTVNQSMNVSSMAKKEQEVKKLFAVIDEKFPLRLIDPNTRQLSDRPVLKVGYFPWLMALAKKDDIVLPEDGGKVLDAITKFEAKVQDPDFASPKDIARYPTLVSLVNAVTRGETDEPINRDRIPDGPGVQLVGTAKKYGHYYELYAVTTPEQGSKLFNQANMGRTPAGAAFSGWCVKDPTYFNSSSYCMGPNNPGYMFRRDGLAYALSDIKSGSVKDRNDKDANNSLTVELLGSMQSQMPPKLADAIIRKNPWSNKHYDEIKKNGIDGTINTIFAKAAGEFGESSTASKIAANDAIDFMKNFEWTYPTQQALSYIYANPWLAMGYAVRSIKNWVPELHPVIESAPAALAAYYDFAMRDLRLDRSGYPDYKEKALQWAAKGGGQTEDAAMCYLPLTFYIRHNPEDIDSIDPQLLEKIKKDSPAIWNVLTSSLKPKK